MSSSEYLSSSDYHQKPSDDQFMANDFKAQTIYLLGNFSSHRHPNTI